MDNVNVSYTYDESKDKFWISIDNAKGNRELIKKIRQVFGMVPVGLIKNLEPEEEEKPEATPPEPVKVPEEKTETAPTEAPAEEAEAPAEVNTDSETEGLKCPDCGKPVVFGDTIACDCGFKFDTTVKERKFTEDEVADFFKNKETPVLNGFISRKSGSPKEFPAKLTLQKGGKLGWSFPKNK